MDPQHTTMLIYIFVSLYLPSLLWTWSRFFKDSHSPVLNAQFLPHRFHTCIFLGDLTLSESRPTLLQIKSFKLCHTTFLNYTRFADILNLRFKNCEKALWEINRQTHFLLPQLRSALLFYLVWVKRFDCLFVYEVWVCLLKNLHGLQYCPHHQGKSSKLLMALYIIMLQIGNNDLLLLKAWIPPYGHTKILKGTSQFTVNWIIGLDSSQPSSLWLMSFKKSADRRLWTT